MEEQPAITTVYLDDDFICHAEDSGGLMPYDTSFFDGRADQIALYRIVPPGYTWTRTDGAIFRGEMIAPIQTLDPIGAVSTELLLDEPIIDHTTDEP